MFWDCDIGRHNVGPFLHVTCPSLDPRHLMSVSSGGHGGGNLCNVASWRHCLVAHLLCHTSRAHQQRREAKVRRGSLQWRHNGRDGVSNQQPRHCLLNHLFRSTSRKHQSSASLAFVRGIHWWPVNSPHKWPVTRKMFPSDDVIMVVIGAQALIEPTYYWISHILNWK